MRSDVGMIETALLVWAFLGLGLMGLGVSWRDPRAHLLRAAGWMVFGLYWPSQASHYFEVRDPFNAWASLFAPLLTGYIAFHEWRSYRWGEDPVALRWLTGATFVAATTYFVLFQIKPIQEEVIFWTGVESAWMSDLLFGTRSVAWQEPFIGQDGYRATHICLDQGYYNDYRSQFCSGVAQAGFPYYAVTIIFACTALQSIMIFVGAIAFTSAPLARKMKAYLWTVPTIYVLNLFRNAGIVYGYRVKGWSMFGIDSFEFMHSYIGKTGALLALVLIALAVFRTLPELHENILDVLDLPKRKRAQPPAAPAAPSAAAAGK